MQTEDSIFLGGTTTLTFRESLVNDILMSFKAREYKQGLESNGEFEFIKSNLLTITKSFLMFDSCLIKVTGFQNTFFM